MRVHHLDEGPADAAETILLMHGEPSWSFLYRHMIPVLTDAGHRCVAPGPRRLRPLRQAGGADRLHLPAPRRLDDAPGSRRTTSTASPWCARTGAGCIGLRLVAAMPERFRRVVAANTFLPTGDRDPGDAFLAWQRFSQEVPEFPTGAHRQRRLHHRPHRRRHRRLRRTVPRRVVQGRRPPVPAPGADPPDDPAAGAEPGRLGGARGASSVRSSARSRDSDPITGGGDAAPAGRDPGRRRASRTPPSSAAATSSRRTAVPSWPPWSRRSSRGRPRDPPHDPRRARRRRGVC